MQDWKKWYLKEAARTTLVGVNVLKTFYSLQLQGVDWVFTLNDIAENGFKLTDAAMLVNFLRFSKNLPVSRGSRIKIATKEGKIISEFAPAGYGARMVRNPRLYPGAPAGSFGLLEGKKVTISQEGLTEVRRHLSRQPFLDKGKIYAPNQAMLDRLGNALRAGQKLEGADAAFYLHELMESSLFQSWYLHLTQNGMEGSKAAKMAYEISHDNTLKFFQAAEAKLYHPDVINAYKRLFEDPYFAAWGLPLPRSRR